jgi:hypothetical protein
VAVAGLVLAQEGEAVAHMLLSLFHFLIWLPLLQRLLAVAGLALVEELQVRVVLLHLR